MISTDRRRRVTVERDNETREPYKKSMRLCGAQLELEARHD